MRTHEGVEPHGGHGDNPLVLAVSVTVSMLAVLVAAVTLVGYRAHTGTAIKIPRRCSTNDGPRPAEGGKNEIGLRRRD